MLTLSPSQRRELRARAHPLHPVVAIGHAGLTPAVLHEIDVALAAHELVKVRVHSDDRDERERFLAAICDGLDAGPVQHLGKLLIVWRPKPAPSREERERPRSRAAKSPAHRRDERAPKGPPGRRGPPEPKIGARARKHRRGASRRELGSSEPGAAPTASRRRTTRRVADVAVPTTSAPRGQRYAHGKPLMPGGARRKRAPSAPATGAPGAVRRRRRPTGGR